MKIEKYKSGVKVTGATEEQRREILSAYDAYGDFVKVGSDSHALFGLFGVAPLLIADFQ